MARGGTLPQQLRVWAENRKRLDLDDRLLNKAADEIEKLRDEVKRLRAEAREASS